MDQALISLVPVPSLESEDVNCLLPTDKNGCPHIRFATAPPLTDPDIEPAFSNDIERALWWQHPYLYQAIEFGRIEAAKQNRENKKLRVRELRKIQESLSRTSSNAPGPPSMGQKHRPQAQQTAPKQPPHHNWATRWRDGRTGKLSQIETERLQLKYPRLLHATLKLLEEQVMSLPGDHEQHASAATASSFAGRILERRKQREEKLNGAAPPIVYILDAEFAATIANGPEALFERVRAYELQQAKKLKPKAAPAPAAGAANESNLGSSGKALITAGANLLKMIDHVGGQKQQMRGGGDTSSSGPAASQWAVAIVPEDTRSSSKTSSNSSNFRSGPVGSPKPPSTGSSSYQHAPASSSASASASSSKKNSIPGTSGSNIHMKSPLLASCTAQMPPRGGTSTHQHVVDQLQVVDVVSASDSDTTSSSTRTGPAGQYQSKPTKKKDEKLQNQQTADEFEESKEARDIVTRFLIELHRDSVAMISTGGQQLPGKHQDSTQHSQHGGTGSTRSGGDAATGPPSLGASSVRKALSTAASSIRINFPRMRPLKEEEEEGTS
ncbi:unnamed protein product [Amoebophrya sp. A25]|nr:unnamed protein product [Amoebophrya sp. A25]|eukprot:GSA25T00021019001.1